MSGSDTATQRPLPPKKGPAAIRVSPLLTECARKESAEVLQQLQTSPAGLSQADIPQLQESYGRNEVAREKQHGWLWRLLLTLRNPLVILLAVLAAISYATEDYRAGTVMVLMVILGVVLRFVQESRADAAAAKLKAMISVTAAVMRNGVTREIPLGELVPGDIVKLAAGDMIPADVRVISSKDLFVIQSSLTGESLPVEKTDLRETRDLATAGAADLCNICFLGTSVESGSSTAVVVATGSQTYFGSMASSILGQQEMTSFDRGIQGFTWLMIRFMAVMVPLVFLIIVITKGNPDHAALETWRQWLQSRSWNKAFFFAMAVAVGLTPEMLPMIVSVCLSKGAMAMSRKKVIVKRLNSIQNFGAMDVLCTDKTGTLTMDHVILERHCDIVREESDEVLLDAYTISYYQTGLKNVLDRAILDHEEMHQQQNFATLSKVDEIPFDFQRRIMSVVIENTAGWRRLLTKGAPESIFARCTHFELNGDVDPINDLLLDDLKEEYERLSADGFRVLAVAYKDVEKKAAYSREDECGLVLRGYVAFLDPPKDSTAPAIAALNRHGVDVKVLTGDNDLVAKKVCGDVGLPNQRIVLGNQVEAMNDQELADAAEQAHVFARLSPAHKQRIIRALQGRKHVVGYMGDGINDAPALRAADVGISVDSAVDIAKESADVILLEKSLMVLEEGVLEGRKVFANILKYVRMGASSNFGNMFSVLGASAFLPFLPMEPIQVLTNNLLYDFSQVPIPTDEVDAEQIAKPRPWDMGEIKRFILFIGPISSIFDYTTYFIMLYVFGCWDPAKASLFQTGWFVESLMTQTLIIHIIRTNRIPFIQSRPSWPLATMSVAIMAVGMYLPFSPLASAPGFTALPPLYWPLLAATLLCYILLTQGVKMWLLRKRWI